ncbi:MAG: OmpA family protein [Deltaproteobacteria bacterium]|nr:OmpA family protein [Deltaproteobacteria bacterium]
MSLRFRFFAVFLSIFFLPLVVLARDSNSLLKIRPALDGGRYFATDQSQTLWQMGYHVGVTGMYLFEPVELSGSGGGRRAGVVDDLYLAHVTGALGVTDWLNIGLDVPAVVYETFYNYIYADGTQCTVGLACAKRTRKAKLGDILFGFKVRLLDAERNLVGLSVQPFVTIPTGSGYYMGGYGFFTGGAKFIVDTNIKRKVFLALNIGYQAIKENRYAPDTAFAKINDVLTVSGGAHVPLGRDFALIGEVVAETLVESPFKHKVQTPVEALAGVRFSPGNIKKLTLGFGGGMGLTAGVGAPKFRAMAQAMYRLSNVVELEDEEVEEVVEVEAPFEEKIVITQRIHFEFGYYRVRDVSTAIIDDVAEVMRRNPQVTKVRIEGHTDDVGSDIYNQKLSQRRAEAVREYMIGKGIEPHRLQAVGYGESRPVADNETLLGRAKNRRTEFTVVDTAE